MFNFAGAAIERDYSLFNWAIGIFVPETPSTSDSPVKQILGTGGGVWKFREFVEILEDGECAVQKEAVADVGDRKSSSVRSTFSTTGPGAKGDQAAGG